MCIKYFHHFFGPLLWDKICSKATVNCLNLSHIPIDHWLCTLIVICKIFLACRPTCRCSIYVFYMKIKFPLKYFMWSTPFNSVKKEGPIWNVTVVRMRGCFPFHAYAYKEPLRPLRKPQTVLKREVIFVVWDEDEWRNLVDVWTIGT